MKKHLLKSLLALALVLICGNVWGANGKYVIDFNKGTTNGTSISQQLAANVSTMYQSGETYVQSITSTNCYYNRSGCGIRIAKSGGQGSLTVTFSGTIQNAYVTSVIIYASAVAEGNTLGVTINNSQEARTFNNLSTYSTSNNQSIDYQLSPTIDINGQLESITFTAESKKYVHLHRIVINTDPNVPSISCSDITNVSYQGVSNETVNATFNNAEGWTPSISAVDGTVVTTASIEGTVITYTVSENTGLSERDGSFTIKLSKDGETDITKVVSVHQLRQKPDYATLPFDWKGGHKNSLTAIDGVTASGLGSDYADAYAPYQVNLDGTGDYIQIKTDSQIGVVSIGVKMIGGGTSSSITVKESIDGTKFTDVQTLTISGGKNDVLNLTTTQPFQSDSRYVKFYFTKGSNVGVGPINISKAKSHSVNFTDYGYATLFLDYAVAVPSDVNAYYVTVSGETATLHPIENVIPANTGVVLTGEDAAATFTEAVGTYDAIEGNQMVGSTTEQKITGSTDIAYYAVNCHESGEVGFFAPKGAGTPNGSFTMKANKAYLKVTGTNASNGIRIEGATMIESLSADMEEDIYFDLQGRKVENPTAGLYILNGKKILVK